MANTQKRKRGIIAVALLMILFGIVEIITAFTHNFVGISTTQGMLSAYTTAAVGSLYAIAGLFTLTMKKWGAALAIVFLAADVIGRIALVITGLYPLNSLENVVAIIIGTAIAIAFAIYIRLKWSFFN
jgi:hypothetical protein